MHGARQGKRAWDFARVLCVILSGTKGVEKPGSSMKSLAYVSPLLCLVSCF